MEDAIAFSGERPLDEGGVLRVWGIAAAPQRARGRRGGVQLLINQRPVQSRRLVYATEEAYAELLPRGRFPLAAIFLQVSPDRVDANVHPTKATVKLRDEDAAFGLIQRTLRAALLQPPSRPTREAEGRLAETISDPSPFRPRSRPVFTAASLHEVATPALLHPPRPRETSTRSDPRVPQALLHGLPLLRPLGQLRSTFLGAEGPEGMVLIDQHAAHERVLYERLLARRQAASASQQPLLDPPLLELMPAQAAALTEHEAALATFGFDLEPFGDRTWRLSAIPVTSEGAEPRPRRDAQALVVALLDDLAGAEPVAAGHDPTAAVAACHSAVRAGQTLQTEETAALLHALEACDNPHTCPHGRPTLIAFDAGDLERRFGRR